MIRFEIPVKTLASRDGMNARVHWRTRADRTKKQRTIAKMMTAQAGHATGIMRTLYRAVGKELAIEVRIPSVVTLTRKHSGVALDDDNLRSMMKAIRDGIADALGIKDNDPRVQWLYRQQKTKRNDFGVIVEIDNAES